MEKELNKAIAGYFAAANAHDSTGLTECFAANAVVEDEDHIYRGIEAIQTWNEETSRGYALSLQVLRAQELGAEVAVTALASGNFDGSPAELHFRFALEKGKITRLICG